MTAEEDGATATSSRRSLKAKMRIAVLTERIDVHGPEVAIFRLKPKDHELFEFDAGQYATLGHFDFVSIIEAPNLNTAAKVSIALSARGSVRIETLTAMPIQEFAEAVSA